MKRSLTILMLFLILGFSGCGGMSAFEAKWSEIKVPEGNFAVECPDDRILNSDEDTATVICSGAGADYSVFSGNFDSGDEATSKAAVLRDAREDARAGRDKVFVNSTVERNGRTVQEVVALESSSIPPEDRNSLYNTIRNKEKLLVFEQTFYADKQMFTLTVHYEAPSDPGAYQQVLDKNKEKRERFLNSFRFLESRKVSN